MKNISAQPAFARRSLKLSLPERLVPGAGRLPAGFRSQSHPPATSGKFLCGLLLLCALWLPGSAAATGTWAPLTNPPPKPAGHFLLLSDGTVMAENLSTNWGPGWLRLTPDSHGSYANGTWSNTAAMHCTRLDFASVVLTNGNVFVAGGEYGTGTTNAEIYNPVSNVWSVIPIPAGIINMNNTVDPTYEDNSAGFIDSCSVLLSNGKVLITPVSPATNGNTAIYDPVSNVWTTAKLVRGNNEAEACTIKLPDDSILVIDTPTWNGSAYVAGTNSERYIPSANAWVNDTNVPVSLYDPYGAELGPGLLLTNGKAIFFGATGHTAIYTPSGTTSPGSWVAGPDFPNGQGMPDAPAAMMPNGKILCAVGPVPIAGTEWSPPVRFYEYDTGSNIFTAVAAPLPGTNSVYTNWVSGSGYSGYSYAYGGGTNFHDVTWPTLMLDLPDGTVLFGHRQEDFYAYQPGSAALTNGQPTVLSISTNSDGSLHLTGTLFNGLSQGAAYGDDEQMDSNFPLVRFTDGFGTVRYGRTYNWSRTSVATGSAVVTTECTVPAGASLQNLIQVVVNGIPSVGTGNVVINTNDNGPGSLRQIVASASAGATITFATNLSGQTILLTNGVIALNNNVTINASALANKIFINGNHNSQAFSVGGVNAILNSLIVSNCYSTGYGGAIFSEGNLTLSNCLLVNNQSTGTAGALTTAFGNLTMNQTTVSGNQGGNCSAIYIQDQPATFIGCTINGNSGAQGDAVRVNAAGANSALTVVNSTFSGNSVSGGYASALTLQSSPGLGASATLTNCTVAANTASSGGQPGAIYLQPGGGTSTVGLYNCIVSGNTSGGVETDITGTANTNSAYNLIGAGGGLVNGVNGNQVGVNSPQLSALGNYGGTTQTMPPLLGSPVVDAGSDSVTSFLATDQRGLPRKTGDHVDIGAVEASIVPYVFKNSDSAYGSLRYAATYATNNSTITFSNTLSGQTVLVTNGQIVLNNSLTIDGSALASPVRLNGNHNSRIFSVAVGVSVTLNSLLLTNGFMTGGNWGGAIANSGTLVINNCSFTGNSVDSADNGGAIANSGPLTLKGCTFYGNSGGFSGAIDNRSTCTAMNCTFFGNTAVAGNGGAIDNPFSAALSLLHCTFYGNSASSLGGDIDNYLSQVNLTNTILAASTPDDIYNWGSSTNTAGGSNLVQVLDNAGTVFGANTILAVNPLLGPLANNGGPTLTMLPQIGSPAIDTGVTSADGVLTTDQRGFPRLVGSAVDLGAVEAAIVPYVFNTADSGYGSLRYAITYATNNATITFSNILSGQTILITSGQITLISNVTIDASALVNGVRVAANHSTRIFYVPGGITAALNSLTVTNGFANGDAGGAFFNSGTLSLTQCSVAGNTAGLEGGGIENDGALTVYKCTFFGNSAGAGGGAIDNNGSLVANESTLIGNSGNGVGSGIWAGGTVTLTNCTIVGNNDDGITQFSGPPNLINTIVALNANLNINGSFTGLNNFTSGNPLLGPLTSNGGLTLTMLPLAASPVVDAGNDTAGNAFPTDQRGLPRISGEHVDIGAAELQLITANSPTHIASAQKPGSGSLQLNFTNQSGASFRVLAATNVSLPLAAWTEIGFAVETPASSGLFQFTDPQSTNHTERFYRVKSP